MGSRVCDRRTSCDSRSGLVEEARRQLMPGLKEFNQDLRKYQVYTLHYGVAAYEAAQSNPPGPQRRQLFSLPTGTGKGSIELDLLKYFKHSANPAAAIYLTTSLEVIRSNLTRCGWSEEAVADMSAGRLAEAAKTINCWTYRGYYEKLKIGEAPLPKVFLIDEAHHFLDDNAMSGLIATTNPYAVMLGFTATAYRGTPKGTKALRDFWGEPLQPITIAEAIAGGWLQLPSFHVEALVDDDEFKVVAGEFVQKEVRRAIRNGFQSHCAIRQSHHASLPKHRLTRRYSRCSSESRYPFSTHHSRDKHNSTWNRLQEMPPT